MRNNSHFTLIMVGIAFLIFAFQATAKPVPKWEFDDFWQSGVSICLEGRAGVDPEDCVYLWDCFIEFLEGRFEDDYEGFRQFTYRLQTDTLTEEDNDNLLLMDVSCLYGL